MDYFKALVASIILFVLVLFSLSFLIDKTTLAPGMTARHSNIEVPNVLPNP